MVEFQALLDATSLGNTTWQWLAAATVVVIALLALLVLRHFIRSRYTQLAETAQVELMEVPLKVASETTLVFLVIVALFAGLQVLQLPARTTRLVSSLLTIATFWQAGLWATTAVLAVLENKRTSTLAGNRAAAGTLGIIGFLVRATIWSLVLLLTLDNVGIEIKPLLAGLGIGGIAVALAVQNVLSDLFASLSITLDRPFVVGDSLAVDEFSGTVEYIGVKSTRLRSLSGEQIIIPNSNLLSSRVRNNTRMSERRVVYAISIDQNTPREKLRTIPQRIRALIESHPDVRFDRAHFARIGATSFDFEAVYTVLTPDYNRHMDILQDINLRLIEAFEQDQIALAYPAQRLYMQERSTVRPEPMGDQAKAPS